MDANRFDAVTRTLAATGSRRALIGAAGATLLAALGRGRGADAQVTQAQCGNRQCRNNPGRCAEGCVCCDYGNGNSRCRPPGTCAPGVTVCAEGSFLDPVRGCVPCSTGCDDGNECTTSVCGPRIGCSSVPNPGAPCAGGTLTCNAEGGCGTCTTADACASDGDCAAGEACRNGGCFTPCGEFGYCGEGCSGCSCRWSIENQSQLYCADFDAFIGFCDTTADCPAGTVCDSSFAGGEDKPRRCTRACPVRR